MKTSSGSLYIPPSAAGMATMDSRLQHDYSTATTASGGVLVMKHSNSQSPTKDGRLPNGGIEGSATYAHPYGTSSTSATSHTNHHAASTTGSSAETPFLHHHHHTGLVTGAGGVSLEDPGVRKSNRRNSLLKRHSGAGGAAADSLSAAMRRCSWKATAIFFVVLAIALSAALAYITGRVQALVFRNHPNIAYCFQPPRCPHRLRRLRRPRPPCLPSRPQSAPRRAR